MSFPRGRKRYQRGLINLICRCYPSVHGEVGASGGSAIDITLYIGSLYLRIETKTSKKSKYPLHREPRELQQWKLYEKIRKDGVQTWYAFSHIGSSGKRGTGQRPGEDPTKWRFYLSQSIPGANKKKPVLSDEEGVDFETWLAQAVEPLLKVADSWNDS